MPTTDKEKKPHPYDVWQEIRRRKAKEAEEETKRRWASYVKPKDGGGR